MKPNEFVAMLRPAAEEVQKRFYVPWQVTVAQAALETGWLAHPILDKRTDRDSHNLFGIKADSNWHGFIALADTHEFVNGKKMAVEARFRAYPSYKECLVDRALFLMRNPRYKKAMAATHDPVQFARELQAGGYATDPDYADKLISIMRKYMDVK
jgi:flagellar protein FlgJ